MKRIGVFGGSFDPVHAGHLFVAQESLRAVGLDEVLFVPAAIPPHKLDQVLGHASDRMLMLDAALRHTPEFVVEAMELDREGPSYTIDTVRSLLEKLGGGDQVELYLIIGGDNLKGLGAWREAELLMELVTPLIIHRGEDLEEALEGIEGSLPPHLVEKLRDGLITLEPHPASSTVIREKLGRGEDPGECLPAGCFEIVKSRGLYGYSG